MGNHLSVLLEAASKGDVHTLDRVLQKNGTRSVDACDEVSLSRSVLMTGKTLREIKRLQSE